MLWLHIPEASSFCNVGNSKSSTIGGRSYDGAALFVSRRGFIALCLRKLLG